MKFKPKDPGSAITHFIGWLMALLAAVPLILRACTAPDAVHVIALSIFIVSMLLLYAASTLYHSLDINEKVNKRLKKFDHMMISVLIAGTYTPVCLIAIRGTLGYTLLAIVWGIAIFGIILKAFWVTCPKWVSSVLYIGHGLDLRSRFHPDFKQSFPGSLYVAPYRRHHLHRRRRDLRFEASDLQQPSQKFRLP